MSVCPKTFAMAVRQNNHKKHMCSDWQQDQYVLSIVVKDDECQLSRWYLWSVLSLQVGLCITIIAVWLHFISFPCWILQLPTGSSRYRVTNVGGQEYYVDPLIFTHPEGHSFPTQPPRAREIYNRIAAEVWRLWRDVTQCTVGGEGVEKVIL